MARLPTLCDADHVRLRARDHDCAALRDGVLAADQAIMHGLTPALGGAPRGPPREGSLPDVGEPCDGFPAIAGRAKRAGQQQGRHRAPFVLEGQRASPTACT